MERIVTAQSIAEDLRRELLAGRYRSKEFLPSVREFAATLGVAKNTVAAAYQKLVADNLVRATPVGYQVLEGLASARAAILAAEIDAAHRRLEDLGFSAAEIRLAFRRLIS